MPSRHIFSITIIAMCWLYICQPVGIILLVMTLVLAVLRVVMGVHFIKDVIAGIIYGIICGFIGLLILTVWQMSGYMMIVYIAQIQQIPESVKEAARIDGANSWQLMRYIILPLMMPAFTIGLFLSISSSFKMFDQNLALTQGGPYKSTEMIALNIYNSAFGANEFGFAQAKAIVFLIIVAGIGVTQLVITKRKEVEM